MTSDPIEILRSFYIDGNLPFCPSCAGGLSFTIDSSVVCDDGSFADLVVILPHCENSSCPSVSYPKATVYGFRGTDRAFAELRSWGRKPNVEAKPDPDPSPSEPRRKRSRPARPADATPPSPPPAERE